MLKKIVTISIIVALLGGLFSSSSALASSSTKTKYSNRYGQVTAVSADSITIENLGGVEKTILVNSKTKIFANNGVKQTLSGVTEGAWVFVNTAKKSHTLLAKNIVLVGTKYTGSAYWDYPSEFGTVISVVPSYGEFFMNTVMSGRVQVITNSNTKFINKSARNIAGIAVGMKAVVVGPMTTNGFILAKVVIAFKPSKG